MKDSCCVLVCCFGNYCCSCLYFLLELHHFIWKSIQEFDIHLDCIVLWLLSFRKWRNTERFFFLDSLFALEEQSFESVAARKRSCLECLLWLYCDVYFDLYSDLYSDLCDQHQLMTIMWMVFLFGMITVVIAKTKHYMPL